VFVTACNNTKLTFVVSCNKNPLLLCFFEMLKKNEKMQADNFKVDVLWVCTGIKNNHEVEGLFKNQ